MVKVNRLAMVITMHAWLLSWPGNVMIMGKCVESRSCKNFTHEFIRFADTRKHQHCALPVTSVV